MATIKSKHIIISLAVGFILYLFYWAEIEGYSNQHPGATTHGVTLTQPSHLTFESELNYTATSTRFYDPSNPQRQKILQTTMKGYREETYWGEQHPTYEKVRDMSDCEFDRFIDDAGINDADVYWGATY